MGQKKISVLVDDSLWRELKLRVAQGYAKSQTEVVRRLLKEWFDPASAPVHSPKPGPPETEEIRMLRWIIEHGSSRDQDIARGSLENLEMAIRNREIQPKRKPGKTA